MDVLKVKFVEVFKFLSRFFWRWLIVKTMVVLTGILLFTYMVIKLDSEYISAILITFSEKILGKETEFTHYLKERTHKDLYSPIQLLRVEINDNLAKEGKLHVIINDTQVDEKTIFAIDNLDQTQLSNNDKVFYRDLNLELLNLRFKVLNNVYKNNKNGAMLDLQKITNRFAEKPHSCLEHNLTTQLIYQPIFQLSKNIAVYTEELSTASYKEELQHFNNNYTESVLNLPIIRSAYIPSLILTRNITATCSKD